MVGIAGELPRQLAPSVGELAGTWHFIGCSDLVGYLRADIADIIIGSFITKLKELDSFRVIRVYSAR
jgi:hypothetical protein